MSVSQQTTVFLIITSRRSVGFPDTALVMSALKPFDSKHSHSTNMFFLYAATYLVPPCFVIHFPCSAPNRSNQISFRFVKDPEGLMLTKAFLAFLRFPLPYIYLLSFIFHVLGGELFVVRHIWGGKLMYACLCTGRKRKFLRRLLHPGASPCF